MVTENQLLTCDIKLLEGEALRGMLEAAVSESTLAEVVEATGWKRADISSYLGMKPLTEQGGRIVFDPRLSDIQGRTIAAFARHARQSLARAAVELLRPILSQREIADYIDYDDRCVRRAL